MISADMGIAIPVAIAAFTIAYIGICQSQSLALAYAASASEKLRYYAASQQIVSVIDAVNGSAAEDMEAISNISGYYGISATVTGMSNDSACALYFCRVVEIGGNARLMVMR